MPSRLHEVEPGDVRAVRADPRLARGTRGRPGHAARDPRRRTCTRSPTGDRRWADWLHDGAPTATRSPSRASAPARPAPWARQRLGRFVRAEAPPSSLASARARRAPRRRRRPHRAPPRGPGGPERGFVAPAYAYTPALRRLARRHLRLVGGRRPAACLRRGAARLAGAGARASGRPPGRGGCSRPCSYAPARGRPGRSCVSTCTRTTSTIRGTSARSSRCSRRARRRVPVTYDELC